MLVTILFGLLLDRFIFGVIENGSSAVGIGEGGTGNVFYHGWTRMNTDSGELKGGASTPWRVSIHP
jgi:hypothetical protein